jgi:hypothetical protein
MTTASEQAQRVFCQSVLDDDGGGYPDTVAFVPMDIDNWQEIAWDKICSYGPTVIVDENASETMFVPRHRVAPIAWWNRMRGRIPVVMTWRSDGADRGYQVPATMSRRRLGEINSTATAPS